MSVIATDGSSVDFGSRDFDSSTGRSSTLSRDETTLSPAIGEILERYDSIVPLMSWGMAELKKRYLAEATAHTAFEQRKAQEFIAASGITKEREALSLVRSTSLQASYETAKALRHSASQALRVLEKELGVLEAALHSHNRELRVLGG